MISAVKNQKGGETLKSQSAFKTLLINILECEGDFTKDTSKVNVDQGIFLANPNLESWVSSGVAGYIHLTRGILPLVQRLSDEDMYNKLDNLSDRRRELNDAFLKEMTGQEPTIKTCISEGVEPTVDPWTTTSNSLILMCLDGYHGETFELYGEKSVTNVIRKYQIRTLSRAS